MRVRPVLQMASAVALLGVADVATRVTSRPAARAAVPAASLAALGLSRWYGATWDELGLHPSSWRGGLELGAACAGAVAGLVGLAAALPSTRSVFLDERYRNGPAAATRYALVTVPLQTVAPEEVAFRGVLLALACRALGPRAGAITSCVLFGLWHVPSSLDLGRENHAITARFGVGRTAQTVGVLGTVLSTAAAGVVFVRLRRRTGSLLAPALLHWAFNGAAVVASAVTWSRTRP